MYYWQEDRKNEMARNAEHLHSLAAMEAALDEELERLENEYQWDCRKYVYLQALDCDPVHLSYLSLSIQRMRNLADVLRSLLAFTFEEKLIFKNTVEKQQEGWRNEDKQCNHHHHYHQVLSQHQHSTSSSEKYFGRLKTINCKHSYFQNKLNKHFTRKVKIPKSGSRMISMSCKMETSTKFGKRRKFSYKLHSIGFLKSVRGRHNFIKTSHGIKKCRQ